MNRYRIGAFILVWMGSTPLFSAPSEWKDYTNPLVGVQMQVQKAWQQVELQESPQTGMVAFNISRRPDPHASVSAQRQKMDLTLDEYTKPDMLLQLYEEGYRVTKTELAGRKCVKIVATSKDDKRRMEVYLSSQPPYLDDITFAAPPADWEQFAPTFDRVKQSIRWTR